MIINYYNHLLRCMKPITALMIATLIMVYNPVASIVVVSLVMVILFVLIAVAACLMYRLNRKPEDDQSELSEEPAKNKQSKVIQNNRKK